MLQSFEQKLNAKIEQFSSQHSRTTDQSSSRPTIVCYYCHRENHGTGRCHDLKKNKDQNLVTQQGNNFFLPNGALIPFNPSRPIRHVVVSYVPPRASVSFAKTGFKSSCGLLQPWYPPAVLSQSFAGVYEADPAGRKRHEEPKPYKVIHTQSDENNSKQIACGSSRDVNDVTTLIDQDQRSSNSSINSSSIITSNHQFSLFDCIFPPIKNVTNNRNE
ncbi:hypothetical protein Pst134EA_013297 [Puccinia striiformis f. sp. tritici]|uniref:hypothetical protein n=1 Tax=Puccinia striiformis f. sp. tritici TaxID=168172 RepID=UPI002007F626|nr:hypothetical protein Pst134EA_013297 [Puccinia striiformis f. sp. tritici]KAH9465412.1 hypothetical protein Pst134EA_013297 [Puccinia striiformis f. sp. tritici]